MVWTRAKKMEEQMEMMERRQVAMKHNQEAMDATLLRMKTMVTKLVEKMDAMRDEIHENRRSRSHHLHQSRHEWSQSTAQVYSQSRETLSRSKILSRTVYPQSSPSQVCSSSSSLSATRLRGETSQSQSRTVITGSYHSSQSQTPSSSSKSRTHSLIFPRSQTSSLAVSHNLSSLDIIHPMPFSLLGTPTPTQSPELKQTLSKSSVQELEDGGYSGRGRKR
ncbi:unnamed protein product [Cuscuta epithymum]|uniref:Uncharacterized protein n=1 Tax=Cuscuta epithymum TaxID=186058 RepID=A0AAV0E3J6_9ASTE|nr:unnamed protein product [Cuscuta epithymum]